MITETQKQQYLEEGYFLLEGVIPDAHLTLLREEAARYIAAMDAEMDAQGVETLGINHKGKRYFISKKYKENQRLADFLFSDLMADICRATLGDDAYLFLEQYVIKMAEVGMEFAWHQDSGYIPFAHRPYLTCWCTLDDVNESNGTVYILPYDRAGTRERVEHVVQEGTNDKVGYHGDDPGIPVILPAGSIAVFSSVTFHRSGANTTDGMRRILLAQYSAEPILNPDGSPRHWVEPFVQGGVKVL